MRKRDENSEREVARTAGLTRRHALGVAGAAGAAYLITGKLPGPDPIAQPDSAQAASCVVTAAVEEGPFFIDEGLERSDTRTDTTTDSAQAGVPLTLTLTFIDTSNGCSPVVGATIDVWNANAYGRYSDESSNGTLNEDWLRGYQITDAEGKVTFTTIFPRWYSGRTEHLHVKVRTYSGSTQTYVFTTQLFFPEEVNEAVLATSPYTASGRDKTNETDRLFTTANQVSLNGSTDSGYSGAYTVGLSGLTSSSGSAGTSDSSSGGSIGSGSSPSSGSGDGSSDEDTAGARLGKVALLRPRGRRRILRLRIVAYEAVELRARLTRDGSTLLSKWAAIKSGGHDIDLTIGDGIDPGPARLEVLFTNSDGNRRTVNHRVVLRGVR